MTMPSPEQTNGDDLPEDAGFPVPIDWQIPEGMLSRYTTNYVVQHTEHEFIISFFELQLPILLGPPEVIRAAAENMKSVRATCVARVAVAADRMPALVEILQQNLEQYRTRYGQEEHHD